MSRTVLTHEQSAQVNRLLGELCPQLPGTTVSETINRKLELSLPPHFYRLRARRADFQWLPTPRGGRYTRGKYLPQAQREACLEDPAFEARNDIADRVICRECFAIVESLDTHLSRVEKKTADDYRRLHPGVRLFAFKIIASRQVRIKGGDVEQYARKLMRKFAENYATPAERAAAAADPKYEKHRDIAGYVICRIPRCGFKSVGRLRWHLEKVHEMRTQEEIDAYRREYHWPRITSETSPSGRRKPRKRKKKDRESRTYYDIGLSVEKKIPADRKHKKSAMVEARDLVAQETHLQYDVVAQYHGKFRRLHPEQIS